MSFSHGTNDAQKTMGILTLTLFTATKAGTFNTLPSYLGFLRATEFAVPLWIKVMCALTMAAGTAAGGWRIIQTTGDRPARLLAAARIAGLGAKANIIGKNGRM